MPTCCARRWRGSGRVRRACVSFRTTGRCCALSQGPNQRRQTSTRRSDRSGEGARRRHGSGGVGRDACAPASTPVRCFCSRAANREGRSYTTECGEQTSGSSRSSGGRLGVRCIVQSPARTRSRLVNTTRCLRRVRPFARAGVLVAVPRSEGLIGGLDQAAQGPLACGQEDHRRRDRVRGEVTLSPATRAASGRSGAGGRSACAGVRCGRTRSGPPTVSSPDRADQRGVGLQVALTAAFRVQARPLR